MSLGRGGYFSALSTGGILEERYVEDLLQEMASRLTLEPVPQQLLSAHGDKAVGSDRQLSLLPTLPKHIDRPPQRLPAPPQIRLLVVAHALQHLFHVGILRVLAGLHLGGMPLQPFIAVPILIIAHQGVDQL